MIDRRAEVVARLKALEEAAAPLVEFLQNASAMQELRADKQYNLQMLHDRYQVVFLDIFSQEWVTCWFSSYLVLCELLCRNYLGTTRYLN